MQPASINRDHLSTMKCRAGYTATPNSTVLEDTPCCHLYKREGYGGGLVPVTVLCLADVE